MSWVAVGVGVGGAALSAGGGLLGGASANRNARRQFDEIDQRTGARVNQAAGLFGGQGLVDALNGDPRTSGDAVARAFGAPGGVIPRFADLGRDFSRASNREVGRFDTESSRLSRMGGRGMGLAAAYGRNRDAIIRNDSADSLNRANGLAAGRLAASGIGSSTIASSAFGDIERRNQNDTQRALQDSADASIDRQISANDSQTGREYGRDAIRTQLGQQSLGDRYRYRTAPLTLAMQAMQSPIINPYLGQSAGNSAGAGVSGLGSALNGVGNTLSLLGAQQYASQNNGGGGGGMVRTPAGLMSAADAQMYYAHGGGG